MKAFVKITIERSDLVTASSKSLLYYEDDGDVPTTLLEDYYPEVLKDLAPTP
jgi:hypothetical protein